MNFDYWEQPLLQPIAAWLMARGFIRCRDLLVRTWSARLGFSFIDLEFYPHIRGCDVIVGHQVDLLNTRLRIGTCQSLEDVKRIYDALRLINGHPGPEDEELQEHAAQG